MRKHKPVKKPKQLESVVFDRTPGKEKLEIDLCAHSGRARWCRAESPKRSFRACRPSATIPCIRS